jgi:ABC-type transport system substrate-binding protein
VNHPFCSPAPLRVGRRLRLGLTAWVFLYGALILPACSERASAKKVPVTLQIGVAAPRAGVPGGGASTFRTSYLLFETLVGIGPDGRPLLKLVASDPEWLPDRLGLRLRLRPDVKFHDGTLLTPELTRQILLAAMREPAAISYKSVTSIDIDGTDSIILRLSRPEAFLLSDLAGTGIVQANKPDIGTGPYKLVPNDEKKNDEQKDGEKKDHVKPTRFAAFDDYYRGRPSIDFVEVKEYQEQRKAWAALMRGDINAVHEITPGAVGFVEAQKTINTYSYLRPYYLQLGFNLRHPVLGRVATRQALSQAVDRQQIIDLALNTRGQVAEGPIWPSHWAYSTAQKPYGYNPEAATLRLDAAGLTLKPGVKPGDMPNRFRFTCLTVANEERYEKMALVLQKQFHSIGVEMDIEVLPLREMLGRTRSGQFDAFLLERSSGRSLAWTYMAFHSRLAPVLFFADTGYSAADDALERLRSTTAESDIRTAVGDLQQVFYQDPPAIFLAWPNVTRAVSTRFEVPPPDQEGRDVMSSLWLWRPVDAQR